MLERDTTKPSPQIRRRSFLQLAVSSFAQTAVPANAASISLQAQPLMASVAMPVLGIEEATRLSSLFLNVIKKTDRDYFKNHAPSKNTCSDYTYHHELMRRLGSSFTLYSCYSPQHIVSAQNSTIWSAKVDAHVKGREDWNAQGVAFDDDPDMRSFPNNVVTHQGLIKELLNVIDQILDIDEKERSQPRRINQHDWPYFGKYYPYLLDAVFYKTCLHKFPDMQASYIDSLTSRQKIEMILECSFIPANPFPAHLHYDWFVVPDAIASFQVGMTELFERDMKHQQEHYGEVSSSTRDCFSWLKDHGIDDTYNVPRHLQETDKYFSIEGYYQRRDVLRTELDIFFTKRSIRKRLGIRTSHSHHPGMVPPWDVPDEPSSGLTKISRGQKAGEVSHQDDTPMPSVTNLRGVAAVRSTFLGGGGRMLNILRTFFSAEAVPKILEDVALETVTLQLEHSSPDNLCDQMPQPDEQEKEVVTVQRQSPILSP